jgi:peroxiredoxin
MKNVVAIIAFVGAVVLVTAALNYLVRSVRLEVTDDLSTSVDVHPNRGNHALEVGDQAPDFSLKSIDGKVVRLSTYEKGTVVLWFTNLCHGCQAVLPGMVKAHDNYVKKEVTFLAISLLGEDTQTVREVVGKYSLPFSFLSDSQGETYRKFGGMQISPGTCPTNPQFFIINKGKVAYATHFPGTPALGIWTSLDKLIN